MNNSQLDELEQMVKNITPGPWKAEISNKYAFTVAILPPDFPQTMLVGRVRNEQDAAYIVKACTVLPDLIAENRALQEKVQKLEQQRKWLAKKCEELSEDVEDFFMSYHIPAKEWIKRAEQATKKDKE